VEKAFVVLFQGTGETPAYAFQATESGRESDTRSWTWHFR